MEIIDVNCHSSIKIGNVYVDPYGIKKIMKDASYIFITHSHYDHLSIEDIEKVANEKTVFVCTKDVSEIIKGEYTNNIIVVDSNSSFSGNGISFSTFPSYNINKQFHPFSSGWVGYIIEVDGLRYAILGDSDLTEEAKNIKCDVLFVPIGGTYTMNAREASILTNTIKPKLVIPVHYNSIVGNKKDEKEFIELLENVEYKIFL